MHSTTQAPTGGWMLINRGYLIHQDVFIFRSPFLQSLCMHSDCIHDDTHTHIYIYIYIIPPNGGEQRKSR